MGKQRSAILRKKAKELLKIFPDKFSNSFEDNKTMLNSLGIFNSSIDRNIVAGILVKISKPKEL